MPLRPRFPRRRLATPRLVLPALVALVALPAWLVPATAWAAPAGGGDAGDLSDGQGATVVAVVLLVVTIGLHALYRERR